VGFMSRGANGGRVVELVTRDFLGGCAGADDAAARHHDAAVSSLDRLVSLRCSVLLLAFGRNCSRRKPELDRVAASMY
jgi:hypothetical protein